MEKMKKQCEVQKISEYKVSAVEVQKSNGTISMIKVWKALKKIQNRKLKTYGRNCYSYK